MTWIAERRNGPESDKSRFSVSEYSIAAREVPAYIHAFIALTRKGSYTPKDYREFFLLYHGLEALTRQQSSTPLSGLPVGQNHHHLFEKLDLERYFKELDAHTFSALLNYFVSEPYNRLASTFLMVIPSKTDSVLKMRLSNFFGSMVYNFVQLLLGEARARGIQSPLYHFYIINYGYDPELKRFEDIAMRLMKDKAFCRIFS